MICAPIIALVEIATSGALSAAIGGVLGSQILGGAVLGLIASGGKPEGALLGGLGAAFSGGLGGAAAETGGAAVDAATTAGTLANQTVENMGVGMSAKEFEQAATGMKADSYVDAAYGNEAASSAANAKAAKDASSEAGGKAGQIINETPKPAGGGIMSRIEGITKEYPTITKIGLGMIRGIGESKMQEDLLEKKYALAGKMERDANDRAYRGVDTSLPFRPSSAPYQSPLQKYLGSTPK